MTLILQPAHSDIKIDPPVNMEIGYTITDP